MREPRETANAAMDQVIPRSARDIASGRAEDSLLCHKTFALCANVLYAAAGESGFWGGQQTKIGCTA